MRILRALVATALAGCGLTLTGEGLLGPDAGEVDASFVDGSAAVDGASVDSDTAEGSVVEASTADVETADVGAPDADAGDADASVADADAGRDADADADTKADADANADADADARPPCLSPAAGMVAWWPGDGNMNDLFSTHDGKSGVESTASPVTYGPGEVGQAFALGGTSFVEVPNHGQLTPNRITLEGWVRATTLGGRIIDKIAAGQSNGYLLDTNAQKLRMIVGTAVVTSPANLPTNTWVHVAGTFDGAVIRLYVDGLEVATGAAALTMPSNGLTLRLGADSNGNNRIAGALDELAIYNRALSPVEVAAIHAAGTNGRCKP